MKTLPEDTPTDYFGYEDECTRCGSTHVFHTFDGVRVCRYCGYHSRFKDRPINVITHNLVWQHERAEKAKRKVAAQNDAVDLQNMIKQIFNIPI